MSERWGDSKRDRDALDRHITRADPDDEIADGMLRWEPGTLSTRAVERIATDALADLWRDCYRREASEVVQQNMFREKVMDIIRVATGQPMEVVKVPAHVPPAHGGNGGTRVTR